MSKVKAARRIRCALCDALFTRTKPNRKYCSDTCRFRAANARRGHQPDEAKRKTVHPKPCRICGKLTRFRFCNRLCRFKWFNLKATGCDMAAIDLQTWDAEDARFEARWKQMQQEGRCQ